MSARRNRAPKGGAYSLAEPVSHGTVLSDAHKRQWLVGSPIAQGGFGCIYSVQLVGERKENFVAKIEPQQNGPLFTEIHFYIRACSQESINKWIVQNSLKFLGIPRYVSSGLFSPPGKASCRFLIMDRFAGDLESVLKTRKLKTVNVVRAASHVLDALEYLHSRDYAHADIKASNLLYNDSFEQVTLVDFGLVHLFRIGGVHCQQKPDPKFKHNGTLEFCSRDAHTGLPPARRGDLEILLYNLIHWIARCQPGAAQSHSAGLPWGHLISDPKLRQNVPDRIKMDVAALKEKSMQNVGELCAHSGLSSYTELSAFAHEIDRLAYDETPNYRRLHQHLMAICKQTTSTAGARKVGPTGKRSSNESPSAVPNAQSITDTDVQSSTKRTTPLASKRSRGRPVSTSKVCKNSTTTTRSTSANADGKSKPATVRSVRKIAPRTPTTSPMVTSTTPNAAPTSTSSSRRPLAMSPLVPSPNPVSLRTDRIHDLFPDDDDDMKGLQHRTEISESPRLPKPSGRKVLTPLNTPVDSRSASTPHSSNNRRRSAFCQTSPELLLVAKAEALGRRAAELASRKVFSKH
ncbi:Serine/threonine-protein kinase vrk1 [Clonorchis sinensis]|uniref:non-specific serine/threonine protein kinase n=1 Tax=Clonorchis sinensis TaxID=79923 RepID=A0A8T1LZ96_CLOSI|nr:Serine/threonine-protein kinase vrk1 [Clonorchis sinensis]